MSVANNPSERLKGKQQARQARSDSIRTTVIGQAQLLAAHIFLGVSKA